MNENPDPNNYVRGEGGAWLLKPRQCYECRHPFTPKKINQEKCEECMEKQNNEQNDKNLFKKKLTRSIVYYKRIGDTAKVAELEAELQRNGIVIRKKSASVNSDSTTTQLDQLLKLAKNVLESLDALQLTGLIIEPGRAIFCRDSVKIEISTTKQEAQCPTLQRRF